MSSTVIIAGSGGIGRAVGLILADDTNFRADIFLGDLYLDTANSAVDWIKEGVGNDASVYAFKMEAEGLSDEMKEICEKGDIILDCLPGSQAPRMAQLAKDYHMHYANLTEYVKETNEVIEIAKGADTGFVLQTGLAPGFINVLANKLYQQFKQTFNSDMLESMKMKVGALSQHAKAPHFYAFTWSPIGVATEYVKKAVVVRDYETKYIDSLSSPETIIIDGFEYEDNYTSGGAANLPEAFAGKIRNLDYKTIRYPGHYDWVQDQIKKLNGTKNLPDSLEETMLDQIPMVEDDQVIIYASVTGKDEKGFLRSFEKSYRIDPCVIGNQTLRAIQSTTAAPLCEIARMLLTGRWKGPIFQSDIDTNEFLNGPFVSKVYGKFDA